jgi:transcriptional regulator with XRE-family HTH domain
MSVVRNPTGGSPTADANDRPTQSNLVCLSEADRVRDEPPKYPVVKDPRDAAATFVIESDPRGTVDDAQGSCGAVEHLSPREDSWSGLEVGQTLGQLMTETRKHLGFSREQVASRINIPAYYVRMIESDTYDAIPDQLYLLPFFQRYAVFLGLDAQKVVSRFICDFEKAENQVLETPARKQVPSAKTLLLWRQIAAASIAGGILLPCIAWGIAAIRDADRHPAAVPSTEARPAAAQDSAGTPAAVAVVPAKATTATNESSSGPLSSPPIHAQAKPRRTGRTYRPRHRSRHWRSKTGHLT